MKAVTLRLDDELFALEAANVREILDMIPVTRVPNVPAFVAGLVNVRGSVVPLADFRVMFGMTRNAADPDTRIVVLETAVEGEPLVVGLLADRVEDVADLDAASIEAAPRVGLRWPAGFVRGVGQSDGRFIIIPDLERIFAGCGGEGAASGAERRT
jgi:purine-binding chemotaxis protein CheW